jgi:hypothetical protein
MNLHGRTAACRVTASMTTASTDSSMRGFTARAIRVIASPMSSVHPSPRPSQIRPTATLFHMPIDFRVDTSSDTFASGLYLASIETAADSRVTKVALIK